MAIKKLGVAKKSLSNKPKTPMKSPSKRSETPMKSPSGIRRTPIKRPSNANKTPMKSLSSISKTPMESPINRRKTPMKSPANRSTTPMKSPSKRSKVSRELEKDSEVSGSENSESDSEDEEKKRKYDKKTMQRIDNENKGVRLIACKICGKEFKLYFALVKHQKVHIKQIYECVPCKKRFRLWTTYKTHMKNEHPNLHLFPCSFHSKCEESFKTQKQRRDHEKCHMKYSCQFCLQRFLGRGPMRKHVKEVHY